MKNNTPRIDRAKKTIYATKSFLIKAGQFDTTEFNTLNDIMKGECNVQSWSDIVAIAVGDFYTVGLKADGTVVAVGSNESGQCDVQNWSNIVAIAAGAKHTVGLKADGTVVCVGDYDLDELEDINNWDLW